MLIWNQFGIDFGWLWGRSGVSSGSIGVDFGAKTFDLGGNFDELRAKFGGRESCISLDSVCARDACSVGCSGLQDCATSQAKLAAKRRDRSGAGQFICSICILLRRHYANIRKLGFAKTTQKLSTTRATYTTNALRVCLVQSLIVLDSCCVVIA